MNNTIKNKIKSIPTGLNFFFAIDKRFRQLTKQGNISRILILILIIWNLIISINILTTKQSTLNLPEFTDVQNIQIAELEEIPLEELELE